MREEDDTSTNTKHYCTHVWVCLVSVSNEGHSGVMLLSFLWGRHEGEIAELPFPTLLLFQQMLLELWSHHRTFSVCHGSHPNPLNMMNGHLGEHELWGAGSLLSMTTFGYSRGIVYCFVIQPQASEQGILPSQYLERPLWTAVLELTLCFDQN